jgi:hypothetical protein
MEALQRDGGVASLCPLASSAARRWWFGCTANQPLPVGILRREAVVVRLRGKPGSGILGCAAEESPALRQVPKLPAQKSAGKGTKSVGKVFSRHKKKCCIYSSRGRSLPALFEKCRYMYVKAQGRMPVIAISGSSVCAC